MGEVKTSLWSHSSEMTNLTHDRAHWPLFPSLHLSPDIKSSWDADAVIPTLQMRKPRLGEVKVLVQGHSLVSGRARMDTQGFRAAPLLLAGLPLSLLADPHFTCTPACWEIEGGSGGFQTEMSVGAP